MSDCVGWIVRAKAGRDKDGSFCVIGRSGEYLLLADGKRRRVSRPKRKNGVHVALVDGVEHPTLEKVRSGQSVGDRELRCALAQIRDRMEV